MDITKLIELLNGDLELEYRSIVQYVQHIATAKGAEFQSTIEELRAHLSQELDHATALAEQIDFLGGVPSVTVPSVPEAADTRAALTLDLELERGPARALPGTGGPDRADGPRRRDRGHSPAAPADPGPRPRPPGGAGPVGRGRRCS